ncbi:MAG: ParB N-terminal domain-containing protein [bacterium]
MIVKESTLRVVDLPVEGLAPNPWNPNRVAPELYAKLRAYIEREGFVEPLVVRRQGEGYQILGGYHRWMIAKELGYTAMPCVVVELDDRRAKILSVNLNELKGQSVPSLLAALVHDLSRELSLDDLASQLPYNVPELDDLLRLLQIPDGLEARLAAEAERLEKERTRVLAFALSAEQEVVVEQAVGKALADLAGGSRGAALTHIARAYLGVKP